MKVAVTGGTGFVGRHVIAELERRGLSPMLVVRQDAAASPDSRGRTVVGCDFANPPANLFAALGEPDVLIHLAWGGLPNYASLHHFDRELPLQYRFVTGLISSGLSRCLVSGTCLEYGLQTGALTEGVIPRPTTPYGFAKDCLRRQLEFFRERHPFSLAWGRLFYVYGEGQAQGSLYSQLKTAAQRGDRTFDMSGGEQLRDYLPIQEAARLLVTLALSTKDAGIVNVCSGFPVSVRRMVERWMKENGWKMELNLGRFPYPEYEPMEFWGDTHKLNGLLAAEERGLSSSV